MNSEYFRTTSLLLRVAPIVFASRKLALKGGTGINLFLNNFPRLSVDIDCTFVDASLKRSEALKSIESEIDRISETFRSMGLVAKKSGRGDKVSVSDHYCLVKIEINTIMRGTLLKPVDTQVCPALQAIIPGSGYSIPVLDRDELYASKLVAALDRQHPRDLFDVMHLFRQGGFTKQMLDCFVIYLICHNRPMHEVLAGHNLPLERLFHNSFVGMTEENISLDDLKTVRDKLKKDLIVSLGVEQKQFLLSFAAANPDWSLTPFSNVSLMPGVQWKLKNLLVLKKRNIQKYDEQLQALDAVFQHSL